MDKKLKKAILAAGAVAGATAVAIKAKKEKENIENEKARTEMQLRDYNGQHAWFIGGGLASMAGAAYLVRDCNYPGDQITIFEGMKILGGSNDGAGDPGQGFVCRGGRMLNEETYENFWELFSSIQMCIRDRSQMVCQVRRSRYSTRKHQRVDIRIEHLLE